MSTIEILNSVYRNIKLLQHQQYEDWMYQNNIKHRIKNRLAVA